MKIIELINATPAFNKIRCLNISTSLRFKLKRLISELQTEIDLFNEAKIEIINKYSGEINQNGNVIFPNATDENSAHKEFNELLNTDININFDKIITNEDLILSLNDEELIKSFVEIIE
jgi:hypothetical protein